MAATGRGRDFWEPHVNRVQASGQSVVGYAREHELSSHSLGWWKRRLRVELAAPLADPSERLHPSFVAVQVAAPVSAGSLATLRLGGGVSLELTQWPDVNWLAALSQANAGAR